VPARIVSLVPSLTESICALGECARLVGTDRYSNWPEPVRTLPKLGGLDDAQVERIAALKPDLVLAAPSARAVERLEGVGLKVIVLHSRSHQDVKRSLQLLATLWKIRAWVMTGAMQVPTVKNAFDEQGVAVEAEAWAKRCDTLLTELEWAMEATRRMNA